jgi:hypothetical protein
LIVEQRLRKRQVGKSYVGVGDIGELNRKVIADVFLGKPSKPTP